MDPTVLGALIGLLATTFGGLVAQIFASKQRALDREAEVVRSKAQFRADQERWGQQHAAEARVRAEAREQATEERRETERQQRAGRRLEIYRDFLNVVERIRVMRSAPESVREHDSTKANFYDLHNEVLLLGELTLEPAEEIRSSIELIWYNRELSINQPEHWDNDPNEDDLRNSVQKFRSAARTELNML